MTEAASVFFSIGRLVDELKDEFVNISVSKVRFLENEGLIEPVRTKGGYRKFSQDDCDRLRLILRMQNDEYLPLSVIKERLSAGQGSNGSPAAARPPLAGSQEAPAALRPAADSSAPDGIPVGESAGIEELSNLTGVSLSELQELERYGMLPQVAGSDKSDGPALYGTDAYAIARIAKDLSRYGLQARHLKMFGNFVGREAALCRQVLGPVGKKTPDALHRAEQSLNEMVDALSRLRLALLADALRENFPDLL